MVSSFHLVMKGCAKISITDINVPSQSFEKTNLSQNLLTLYLLHRDTSHVPSSHQENVSIDSLVSKNPKLTSTSWKVVIKIPSNNILTKRTYMPVCSKNTLNVSSLSVQPCFLNADANERGLTIH